MILDSFSPFLYESISNTHNLQDNAHRAMAQDLSYTKLKYQTCIKDKQRYGHPTIKPLKIIQTIIENSSSVGDTILDPFMGSGTSGVACINTNRKFIGIEIDDKYFDIAKKRIKETENDLKLF